MSKRGWMGLAKARCVIKMAEKNAKVDEKKNLLRNEKAKIVVGPTK